MSFFTSSKDQRAEQINTEISDITSEIEKDLPSSIDLASKTCADLRRKKNLTPSEQILWDRLGCR
jgi:ElaB/YqjD/DUF883 family membrane-anchored ribosome-binding protein